jgi:pimeloyl-ACP methyl ester carboxylesterase
MQAPGRADAAAAMSAESLAGLKVSMRRTTKVVEANGVELCVSTLGDRADPPILLIGGSSSSMDWWEDEFCEQLAAGPRFVIRYDHRDTGRSVTYGPGAPPYTGRDLVEDAVGLFDALDVARAHLVGISMGGGIAQHVALEFPERVASLTLISTSLAVGDTSDLPSMSRETAAKFDVPAPDWSDRAAVIDYITHLARVSASPSRRFDEEAFRELAARVVERSRDIAASFTNHDLIEPGDPPRRQLGEIDVPVLVIHGRDDPVFPLEHGRALAEAIPGGALLALERTGHELPKETWEVVVPAILEHTGGA